MSLLFESAIGAFSPREASLYEHGDGDDALLKTDGGGGVALSTETGQTDRLPIEAITGYATHHDSLRHPDRGDWFCIPLHDRTSAALSDQYIAYTSHDLRGDVFIYRSGGTQATISADELACSPLAERLRFWHSDHVPDSMPSYYDSPLAGREPARNPLTEQPDTVFDDLSAFVDDERAVQRAENLQRIRGSSPRKLYEQGVDSIPSLRCHERSTTDRYRFSVERDRDSDSDQPQSIQSAYGIYESDEVCLYAPSHESTPASFPLPATVTDVGGQTVSLSIDWTGVDSRRRASEYLSSERGGFSLVSILNPTPFEREATAIAALRNRKTAGVVLTGQADLSFSDSAAALSTPFDTNLNQEQQVAVEHALMADDLFCIHGPPGTGKTRTLIEIVRRAVEAGRSVLVCADSNQAVDNLAVGTSTNDEPDPRSLHAYGQHGSEELTLARLNATRSTHPVVTNYYDRRRSKRAEVVCATNSSAAKLDYSFDLAVVDEATQATCTASCIPWERASKLVLAGDHQQLPPFSATESPPASAYGMSLFEHLYAEGGVYEGVGMQLRTQYRMHADIADFPNRRYYDRTLRNGRLVPSLGDRPAVIGYDIGGKEVANGSSTANPTEARLVAHLMADLVSEGDGSATVDPNQVGIITPYRGQVRAIETAVSSRFGSNHQFTIDTIDSFQGSEQTAVFVSLVRSNPEGRVGFMGRTPDGPRRLNVALTRAKRFCALIGDWDTLRASIGTRQNRTDRHDCTDLYDELYSFLRDTGRLRHVEPELLPDQ